MLARTVAALVHHDTQPLPTIPVLKEQAVAVPWPWNNEPRIPRGFRQHTPLVSGEVPAHEERFSEKVSATLHAVACISFAQNTRGSWATDRSPCNHLRADIDEKTLALLTCRAQHPAVLLPMREAPTPRVRKVPQARARDQAHQRHRRQDYRPGLHAHDHRHTTAPLALTRPAVPLATGASDRQRQGSQSAKGRNDGG
jgi:hypothetical protein